MNESVVTRSDFSYLPPVRSGVIALRLRCNDYWYAMLYLEPEPEEDPVYRHGSSPLLYRERAALLADLALDGFPVHDDLSHQIDVDGARALIGFEMSRDEIDEVITAWNALDDLTAALGTRLDFEGSLASAAYDKLFWGLNLPAVTPVGNWFTPQWWPKELGKIDQVLRECGARVAASIEAT
ncbi:MAG: hypothetical protein ACOH16_07545 [Propionibacteriaceae bacterium]